MGGGGLRSKVSTVVLTVLLVLAFVVGTGSSSGCRKVPDKLVFGFAPSPETRESQITEAETLAKMVGDRMGIRGIHVVAFGSSMEVVQALGAGQVDVGLLSPFGYVAARTASRAQILLRCVKDGKDYTRSQFVVLADGGPRSLEELRGKIVGFVDPASASGYLFPAAHLIQSGIDPARDLRGVVFTGSHLESVRAVLLGTVDAAACREDARELAYGEFRDVFDRVVVIAYTPPVPLDALVVRPGLRPELVADLRDALLKSIATGDGRRSWKVLSGTDDLTEAQDSDYDVVRAMAAALGIDIEVLAGGR